MDQCGHKCKGKPTNRLIILEEASNVHSTKSRSLLLSFFYLNEMGLRFCIGIQGTKFMITSWANYKWVHSQDMHKKLVELVELTSHVTIQRKTNIFQLTCVFCFQWMCCPSLVHIKKLQTHLDWWETAFFLYIVTPLACVLLFFVCPM